MRQGPVRRWRGLAAAVATAVVVASAPTFAHADPVDTVEDPATGATAEIVTLVHHSGSPVTVDLEGFVTEAGTAGQKVALQVTSAGGYAGPVALCVATDAAGNGEGTFNLPADLPLGTYTLNALAGDACGDGVEAPDRAVEASFEVIARTLLAVSLPTVLGKARVGKSLRTTSVHWSGTPDTVTLQWYRNGEAIPGATKRRYKIRARDLGKRLSVTHTATLGDSLSEAATADTTKVVRGVLKAKKKPRIKGTAKVGKKLRATAGRWSPASVKVKYRWLRNGKAIKKATGSTYKVKRADRGKRLQVRVSARKAGYKATTQRSAAKKVR